MPKCIIVYCYDNTHEWYNPGEVTFWEREKGFSFFRKDVPWFPPREGPNVRAIMGNWALWSRSFRFLCQRSVAGNLRSIPFPFSKAVWNDTQPSTPMTGLPQAERKLYSEACEREGILLFSGPWPNALWRVSERQLLYRRTWNDHRCGLCIDASRLRERTFSPLYSNKDMLTLIALVLSELSCPA